MDVVDYVERDLPLFVAVWLVCGAISAVIARSKGGSVVNWFLCGALLGPFGVLLTLIYAKPPAKVPVTWAAPPPEKPSAFRVPVSVAGPSSAPVDPAQRLQQLADLRDRGAITQAEYEAKKAELLARL